MQALKLSDDFNLDEIDCVGLLVSAHQEVRRNLCQISVSKSLPEGVCA